MEKTNFHYFCDLLLQDVRDRVDQDAVTELDYKVGNNLIEMIEATQNFYGHDAPADDAELMADIAGFEPTTQTHKERVNVVKVSPRTLALLRQDLAKYTGLMLLFLLPFLGFSQHKLHPPMESDGAVFYPVTAPKHKDTISVRFILSCYPGVIWTGYKVPKRLSETVIANQYLGPDKKRLPKGCQILQFIK